MQMSTKKLGVQFHLTAASLIRFASIGAVSEKSSRELYSFLYTPGSACRSTQAMWKKAKLMERKRAAALSATENVY